jgi:hypothetical protein
MKLLSKDKNAFKNNIQYSYSLSATELQSLIHLYKEKYHIDIIFNGSTEFGKNCIQNTTDLLNAKMCSLPEHSIKKLQLKNKLYNCNLTLEEACAEIHFIQQSLDENTLVGYFFTNGVSCSQEHYEVFIISKEKIIKPIDWGNITNFSGRKKNITSQNIPTLHSTDTASFYIKDIQPKAQSGSAECGTLALQYLKDLLQDKAQQFTVYSRTFSFYDYEDKMVNFFMPSPHVLRYSQSSFYNKIIAALLNKSDTQITQGGKSFPILCLKKMIDHSITIAKQRGNQHLAQQNQLLKEEWDVYSKKWLQAYQEIEVKHKLFVDSHQRSIYLCYTSNRLHNKLEKISGLHSFFTPNNEIVKRPRPEGNDKLLRANL